jgi:hypothetical protein
MRPPPAPFPPGSCRSSPASPTLRRPASVILAPWLAALRGIDADLASLLPVADVNGLALAGCAAPGGTDPRRRAAGGGGADARRPLPARARRRPGAARGRHRPRRELPHRAGRRRRHRAGARQRRPRRRARDRAPRRLPPRRLFHRRLRLRARGRAGDAGGGASALVLHPGVALRDWRERAAAALATAAPSRPSRPKRRCRSSSTAPPPSAPSSTRPWPPPPARCGSRAPPEPAPLRRPPAPRRGIQPARRHPGDRGHPAATGQPTTPGRHHFPPKKPGEQAGGRGGSEPPARAQSASSAIRPNTAAPDGTPAGATPPRPPLILYPSLTDVATKELRNAYAGTTAFPPVNLCCRSRTPRPHSSSPYRRILL